MLQQQWQQHEYHQQQQQGWQHSEQQQQFHWDSRRVVATGSLPVPLPRQQLLPVDESVQWWQGLPEAPGFLGRTSSNASSRVVQHMHLSGQYAAAAGGAGASYTLLPQQQQQQQQCRASSAWDIPSWEDPPQQHEYHRQQQQQQAGRSSQTDYPLEVGWQQHAQQQQQQQQHSPVEPDRSGSVFSASPNPDAPAGGAGVYLQHRPEGFGLVGCRVRVWWPLDREWYSGSIQVSTLQQQRLLHSCAT
jgi:hypothetical protein